MKCKWSHGVAILAMAGVFVGTDCAFAQTKSKTAAKAKASSSTATKKGSIILVGPIRNRSEEIARPALPVTNFNQFPIWDTRYWIHDSWVMFNGRYYPVYTYNGYSRPFAILPNGRFVWLDYWQ